MLLLLPVILDFVGGFFGVLLGRMEEDPEALQPPGNLPSLPARERAFFTWLFPHEGKLAGVEQCLILMPTTLISLAQLAAVGWG